MRLWLVEIFAAIVMLGTTSVAVAGPFEEAVAAYERKDYARAKALMVPLAEQGYSDAQRELAGWYMTGWAFPTNDAEAFKWYQRAAAQGDASAMNQLGWFYADGYGGVTVNKYFSYVWFALSAKHASNSGTRANSEDLRDTGARGLSGAQVAEAMKFIGDWKPKPEMPTSRP